ncbi:MAG TPA: beta/gamma crystallin-related protein [Rhizomicrobium sp.]|jgi:hypothetical protein|nr:beta/gamma crystallin-related protein [Rhizomicrobium sp.]
MRRALLAFGLLISSMLIPAMAQPHGRATVYRDADFRGEQRQLDRDVRDFSAIGMNDRISSIRVDSGTWEFCEDADFRGRCITVSRDERDLAGSGFDDRLSSARQVADRREDNRDNGRGDDRSAGGRGDDRGGGVTLYADVDFRGDSRESGENRDFRSLNFNDTVSSIRIRSGAWEFCEDADFRGRCMTFDRDVPSLVSYGFNDKISSMRRVR